MKKVKVIVKDKMLLELDEDASKGDVIDLGAVTQVDLSYVDKLIENGKDKVYQNKLLEQEKLFNAKKQIEVNQLNEEIKALKKEQETLLQLKANEITNKYLDQINELKKQLDVVKNNYENQINNLTLANNSKINEMKLSNDNYVKDLLSKATLKYTNLENEYQSFKNQYQNNLELDKKKVELSYLNQITELKNQIEKNNLANEIATAKKLEIQKNDYDHLIKQKEETINQLMRSKSALNVKQTGEDLESWCDNEVNAYMQNGLFNCTWEKDNKVVRNEDETKGSKADYIFKVYAENQHINLLSSICMDMKDENPSSVNKKTNADYYKALDMNRNKKECKYALLVSNLELDKPNVLPIFKVREYEDM
jgi:hypothetical protein